MDAVWGWILWVVIGAVAGWVASLIMGTAGSQSLLMDIIIGIIGALLGGWLFDLLNIGGAGGFWWSLLTAVVGAVILLAILRLFTGGRRTA